MGVGLFAVESGTLWGKESDPQRQRVGVPALCSELPELAQTAASGPEPRPGNRPDRSIAGFRSASALRLRLDRLSR